ncbi:MAG: FTR1 family protein [Microgenomates group bacterium]
MFPSFLITFREVVEAAFIVATLLGIVTNLKLSYARRTVWQATASAAILSITFVGIASIFGLKLQNLYVGSIEQITEGVLMFTSTIFITWAVFFLHKFFSQQKGLLLQKVKKTVEKQEIGGLFILVFTAVFREGFEIVLFLSTIFISTNPQEILIGFSGGILLGITLSLFLFKTTERLPVVYAFRITSALLVLFGAGLLVRGIHEFAEAKLIPELFEITFAFIPKQETIVGGIIKSLFGITQKMDVLQIGTYATYIIGMCLYFFLPHRHSGFSPVRKQIKTRSEVEIPTSSI